MKKKETNKILILTQHFFPEHFQINEIACGLEEYGFEVDVLTAKPNYPYGKFFSGYGFFKNNFEIFNNINIYRVPIIPRGSNNFQLFFNYISFIFFASIIGPLILRRKKYNVVLIYGTSPIFQAIPAFILRKFNICKSVVLWVQDLWPHTLQANNIIQSKTLLATLNIFVNLIYRLSDKILVQSNFFKRHIPFRYLNKTFFQPNSYNDSVNNLFKRNIKLNPYFQKNKNVIDIVYTGNVGKFQSIDLLLETASLLKNNSHFRFHVFGNGSLYDYYLSIKKKQKLKNVFFYGAVDSKIIPLIMKSADLLYLGLNKNICATGVIPNKLQVYLSSSTPIITNATGYLKLMLKRNKSALFVSDFNSFYNILLSLKHKDDKWIKNIGARGKNFFKKKFSFDKVLKKLIYKLKN